MLVKSNTFASPYREVSEWLKEHAWKVCIPLKGIEGSNPFLSASFNSRYFAGIFILIPSVDSHLEG
jgi:hypothetical protein